LPPFRRLGHWGFVCHYPGGVTARIRRTVAILRWRGYVPEFVKGWRGRIGPIEIHLRRLK
jgi:hypothetical protein